VVLVEKEDIWVLESGRRTQGDDVGIALALTGRYTGRKADNIEDVLMVLSGV